MIPKSEISKVDLFLLPVLLTVYFENGQDEISTFQGFKAETMTAPLSNVIPLARQKLQSIPWPLARLEVRKVYPLTLHIPTYLN